MACCTLYDITVHGAQGGRYGNALQAASAGGYEKAVQTLLAAGADVNAQGGEYGNACCRRHQLEATRRRCRRCWPQEQTSTLREESMAMRAAGGISWRPREGGADAEGCRSEIGMFVVSNVLHDIFIPLHA
jgi:hypothetical protein